MDRESDGQRGMDSDKRREINSDGQRELDREIEIERNMVSKKIEKHISLTVHTQ